MSFIINLRRCLVYFKNLFSFHSSSSSSSSSSVTSHRIRHFFIFKYFKSHSRQINGWCVKQYWKSKVEFMFDMWIILVNKTYLLNLFRMNFELFIGEYTLKFYIRPQHKYGWQFLNGFNKAWDVNEKVLNY